MRELQLRSQIGRNLRRCRLDNDPPWTQADFAEAIDVTRSRIGRIEDGHASLSAEHVIILHAVFALDLVELFADCCDSLPGPDPSPDDRTEIHPPYSP